MQQMPWGGTQLAFLAKQQSSTVTDMYFYAVVQFSYNSCLLTAGQ